MHVATRLLSTSVTFAMAAVLTLAAPQPASALDTISAAGQLDAFVRMRGSADGKPVYANWWVTIYAVLPGEKPKAILKLDGYNVARFEKKDDGSVQLISREVAYYKDPASNTIIETWDNPFTKETNEVLQVANDPVNSTFGAPQAGAAGRLPFRVDGNDVFLLLDVPLAYPNPLTPAEFPAESSGPMYVASEHFGFFSRVSDLEGSKTPSVPLAYEWTRTGPWLPWMKMGTRPGYLLYSGHGKKYASFDELPADVRTYTLKHFPTFKNAPDSYEKPNETSWTYYKKMRGPKK